MALSAQFSLLHSDLNDFLFAPVGEEQNGVTLSVVSGLTRLGLDPWEEAARLTPLPKARAAAALATLIARLPIHRTQALDDLEISRRLVELLPAQKMAPLQNTMKYLVPPIVLPVLLFIGVVAYGVLRPPVIVGHPPVPVANSQAR
jgi:hypothetical protein